MRLIQCSHPKITYYRDPLENPPINIDVVTHITKSKRSAYPDNVGHSAITFHFIGGTEAQWVYPFRDKREAQDDPNQYGKKKVVTVMDTTERDEEFDKLVKIFSIPNQV